MESFLVSFLSFAEAEPASFLDAGGLVDPVYKKTYKPVSYLKKVYSCEFDICFM